MGEVKKVFEIDENSVSIISFACQQNKCKQKYLSDKIFSKNILLEMVTELEFSNKKIQVTNRNELEQFFSSVGAELSLIMLFKTKNTSEKEIKAFQKFESRNLVSFLIVDLKTVENDAETFVGFYISSIVGLTFCQSFRSKQECISI